MMSIWLTKNYSADWTISNW